MRRDLRRESEVSILVYSFAYLRENACKRESRDREITVVALEVSGTFSAVSYLIWVQLQWSESLVVLYYLS